MKMRLKSAVNFLFIILFVSSCEKLIDEEKSNHYFYNWNKSEIIYNDRSTWNYKNTVDCDFETFEVIKGKWAKDKNHIIYDGKARPSIDLKTFYFDTHGLPKDSHNVYTTYWSGNFDTMLVWEGADPSTFELIEVEGGVNREMWAKDDQNYYRMRKVIHVDYDSFEILSESYSKDKNNVYYERKILIDADPNTFKYDSLKRVYKDENFEYFRDERKENSRAHR